MNFHSAFSQEFFQQGSEEYVCVLMYKLFSCLQYNDNTQHHFSFLCNIYCSFPHWVWENKCHRNYRLLIF